MRGLGMVVSFWEGNAVLPVKTGHEILSAPGRRARDPAPVHRRRMLRSRFYGVPMAEIDLQSIRDAIAGNAAAFRVVTELQPAGGDGDKIFPPTYEGSVYAVEPRIINGQEEQCVLLDSVQSQANRLESALLEGHRSGDLKFPPRRG